MLIFIGPRFKCNFQIYIYIYSYYLSFRREIVYHISCIRTSELKSHKSSFLLKLFVIALSMSPVYLNYYVVNGEFSTLSCF